MILLISTCHHRLSEREFVDPIANVLEIPYEKRHYTQSYDPLSYEKIIICGTAIRDNEYLNHLDLFQWIKKYPKPLLGICSGMQILGLHYGATIQNISEMGMIPIQVLQKNVLFSQDFEAYALHGNALTDVNEFRVLAKSAQCVQAIQNKNQWGILFHPEVRCTSILKRFVEQN